MPTTRSSSAKGKKTKSRTDKPVGKQVDPNKEKGEEITQLNVPEKDVQHNLGIPDTDIKDHTQTDHSPNPRSTLEKAGDGLDRNMAPTRVQADSDTTGLGQQVLSNTQTLSHMSHMLTKMFSMMEVMETSLPSHTDVRQDRPNTFFDINYGLPSSSIPRGVESEKLVRKSNEEAKLFSLKEEDNDDVVKQEVLKNNSQQTTDHVSPMNILHDSFNKSASDIVSDESLR